MDMQRRYENLLSENQRLISEIDILRQQLTKPADDTISVSKGAINRQKLEDSLHNLIDFIRDNVLSENDYDIDYVIKESADEIQKLLDNQGSDINKIVP
jgi:cell division septum initiation protein DivIVA